jgi:hypothetical protein
MTFETEGFFSKEIDGFRQHVRTTEPFNKWFDYALGLVRIGFEMLGPLETALSDERQLYLNTAFVRVHQALQTALVLAERGLMLDARVVLRSGVEFAIAINALANDAGFVEQLKDAHYRSRRTLARVVKQYVAREYTPEQLAHMDEAIAEADKREAAKGVDAKGRKIELTDIKWEQVANAHSHELYQLLYRSMSADGTHATLDALQRFLVVDATGEIKALKVAPDTEGLLEALTGATLMFAWAAAPFAASNGLTTAVDTIQAKVQEFGTLPGAFASKASPHFTP